MAKVVQEKPQWMQNIPELLTMSATKMIVGLRNKDFSSEELTRAHIERIQKLQPHLNAMTHARFDLAVSEAQKADKERLQFSEDETKPLLGMPITIKEMYATRGMPWTGGVNKHRRRIATEDAEVVRMVRMAGAVILCKTNTSTLTMTHETDNVVFGRTNHPLDTGRTPGGSSGGEAALISAYASPWGVGSDLGGSIRLPAHLCGLAGIRPTYDVIPTRGEYPSWPHHVHMNSAGPIARTVQDARVLYNILSGRQTSFDEHGSQPLQGEGLLRLKENCAKEKRGVCITWLPAVKSAPVDSEMAAAFAQLVRKLSTRLPVQTTDESLLDGVVDLWQDIILSDKGRSMIDEVREGDSFSLFPEIFKALLGKSPYHKWILSLLFGATLFSPKEKRIMALKSEVEKLRAQFEVTVGANGVLLLPVFPWTAPKHSQIANTVYTARGNRVLPYLVLANALGYPAMTVPVGRTKDGFPFGIQVVGGAFSEDLVFAVSQYIEELCPYEN